LLESGVDYVLHITTESTKEIRNDIDLFLVDVAADMNRKKGNKWA